MGPGDLGLFILRLVIGGIFAAHGAQKAFGLWGGPGPIAWRSNIERMGIRPSAFWAPLSVAGELVGGVLLVLGLAMPVATALLIGQSIVIIGHAHLAKGFWNRNGGIEFPLALVAAVVALVGTGPGSLALDPALDFSYSGPIRILFLVAGIVGGAIAVAIPRYEAARGGGAAERR
jgi:putative oxidoreductase